MTRAPTTLTALAAIALAAPAATQDPEPVPAKLTRDQLVSAEKAAKGHLDKLKGTSGRLQRIEDAPLSRALPGHAFFHALFRRYPVAILPPAGLKSSNVFAVDKDGKVTVLTAAKELEAFFKKHAPAAGTDAALKDAARAWLRLSQEFHQDGFFKFQLMDDATKVSTTRQGKEVSARVVVMSGGSGLLGGRLSFDRAGKLTAVSEEVKIRPGPRPICQATKLLDRDSVVRRMAEQDLLIMGRAAKPYLDEQKGKAAPPLHKAIEALWRRILDEDR
jgi:hypothetical protein